MSKGIDDILGGMWKSIVIRMIYVKSFNNKILAVGVWLSTGNKELSLTPKYNLAQGCGGCVFQYIKLILVEQREFYKGKSESLFLLG